MKRLQIPRRALFFFARSPFSFRPPFPLLFFPFSFSTSLNSSLSTSRLKTQPLPHLSKKLRQRRLHRHRDHKMGVLAQEGRRRHRPAARRLCRGRLEGRRGRRRCRRARRVPAGRPQGCGAARLRAGGLQPEGGVQRDLLQREAAGAGAQVQRYVCVKREKGER